MKLLSAFVISIFTAVAADAAPIQLLVTLGGKTLDVRDQQGKLLASYQISPGLAKHPTPQGNFTIKRLVWNPSWVPPNEKWAKGKKATRPGDPKNPMKVVKIFFKEPDLYLHGTGDEAKLGDPASHGCIRLAPADAYALARLVMQNGGAGKSEAWYQNAIAGKSSVTVKLPNPIPIKISA